jgi:FemAB-related protein (PEP-CTERM system-associated)
MTATAVLGTPAGKRDAAYAPAAPVGPPAHLFSVDVEEYFQVNAFEGYAPRERWGEYPSRLAVGVDAILDLLASREASGTFFTLGWVARHHPDVVRRIAAAGHEIASHGYWHRRVVTQTPDAFRQDLRDSKAALEDLVGARVDGYRAPSFSILPGGDWAFDVLLEAGFRYDSSRFPIRRAGYGNPGTPATPYWIRRPAGTLLELPLATARVGGALVPAAGGGYLRQFPYALIRRAFGQADARTAPAMFYVHPWEADPAQPRIPVPWLTRGAPLPRASPYAPSDAATAGRLSVHLGGAPIPRQPRGGRAVSNLASPAASSPAMPPGQPDDAVRVEPYQGAAADWDAFAERQAGFTAFHRYGWRQVMEQALGHECLYLAARDGAGVLVGVLPLVRVRSALFGHYLVSMPFLNYGGPLGSYAAVRALADAAAYEARRSRVKLLEMRSAQALPIDLPVSHRKITVLLDLPDTAEALFKQFDAKLRSQVRRPQKDGIVVRQGLDQVDAFYRVFAEHMRDLGTPVLSRAVFRTAAQVLPDATRVAVAYAGDQPVAGGVGFAYGDEFEITWASALRGFNKSSPNMLVYWELMQTCVREGRRRFNFGRCTPGGGTHKFKRQWGGDDAPLYWYQLAREEGAATPSPDDGAFSWGPRIWRKLPLAVASAVGPHVVRNIP